MASDTLKTKGLDPKTHSSTALKAFFGVAENWELSNEQQQVLLGNPPRSTFFKWKKHGAEVPIDTLERISHLLAIYKNVRLLLPARERADAWVRQPNKAHFLNGRSALDHMLNGRMADIIDVRQYLDAERGGWA
jgi:hypothetical protein